MKLAEKICQKLVEFDKQAKCVASKELLENYNSGWNEYETTLEDGSSKLVSNPKLSEEEFKAKLTLSSVTVTGDNTIHLFYDDEGMFWGLCIIVSSVNGPDLIDAHANLFG